MSSTDYLCSQPRVAEALEALARGQYAEAKAALVAVLEELQQQNAGDALIAECLAYLARAYFREGAFDEAATLAQRSLALDRKAPSPTVVSVEAIAVLASVHFLGRDQHNEAERLFIEAIKLDSKLRPMNWRRVDLLQNLAYVYHSQGRYQEAERLLQELLSTCEQAGTENPVVMAWILKRLAKVYATGHRFEEAAQLLERAIGILEASVGPDDHRLADTLDNLGYLCLHYLPARQSQAETYLRRAFRIFRRTLPADHPNLFPCLDSLASCLQRRGRYARAERLMKRLLRLTRKVYGTSHRDWAKGLSRLANLYLHLGKYRKAERYWRGALACLRKALGPDHPQVSAALTNVAVACQLQGRFAEAETLYRRALINREEVLGPDHPELGTVLKNYGALLRQLGRDQEAAQMEARLGAIRAREAEPLPPEIPDE